MIALNIRETTEPSIDRTGERKSYVVTRFFPPTDPSEAASEAAFREETGNNLSEILEQILRFHDDTELTIGLSGTAIQKERNLLSRGMTSQDVAKYTATWSQRFGFTSDDDVRTFTADYASSTEFVIYAVRAPIMRAVREAARRNNLALVRVTDYALGWAAAVPSDVGLLLDVNDTTKTTRVYLFTPPSASEQTFRTDGDLLQELEEVMAINQRSGNFRTLLKNVHVVGTGKPRFPAVLASPLTNLDTEIPPPLQTHIGLLGLAGYTA